MDIQECQLENEPQFWDALENIVRFPCDTQSAIDTALKAFLGVMETYAAAFLHSDYDWARCALKLLEGPLFHRHRGYVRRRMFGRLRKEQSTVRLLLVAMVLLYDGRENKKVFELMQEEGLFARLVELVRAGRECDPFMWRICLELLYEMSRIQRLSEASLDAIDDEFVKYLFQLVEEDPEDVEDDPFHYPVIRMLLVLNEQYMLCSHTTTPTQKSIEDGPTNKIIKILCYHGTDYRTFGENIVLLINRESETSLQLLILKLLYLLFTTTATYEYFYSNDLRVLIDVIIRNLLDLPDEAKDLRHTYLRVLYPLLNHTQLRRAPHYKRDELLKLFEILGGTRCSGHFEPADSTTVRLVARCMTVSWLRYDDEEGSGHRMRLLGISLPADAGSSMSVVEMAVQTEAPGVLLPSRTRDATDATAVEIYGRA